VILPFNQNPGDLEIGEDHSEGITTRPRDAHCPKEQRLGFVESVLPHQYFTDVGLGDTDVDRVPETLGCIATPLVMLQGVIPSPLVVGKRSKVDVHVALTGQVAGLLV
jgi:hypothetical protein